MGNCSSEKSIEVSSDNNNNNKAPDFKQKCSDTEEGMSETLSFNHDHISIRSKSLRDEAESSESEAGDEDGADVSGSHRVTTPAPDRDQTPPLNEFTPVCTPREQDKF